MQTVHIRVPMRPVIGARRIRLANVPLPVPKTLCGAEGTIYDVMPRDASRWGDQSFPSFELCDKCLASLRVTA